MLRIIPATFSFSSTTTPWLLASRADWTCRKWSRCRLTLRWMRATRTLAFSLFFDPFFRRLTVRCARARRFSARSRCRGLAIMSPSDVAPKFAMPRSMATNGPSAGRRLCDVQLADDAHEPLVAVALEGTGLRLPLERAVHHRAQRAELGEPDVAAIDAPGLRVRFAEGEGVASLPLPPRGAGELGEASLPRPIQFHQELRADVARDVGQPRESSTKLGQLVDLVEGRGVDALVSRPGVAELPLIEREVPQKPESAVPPREPRELSLVGVDAISERLYGLHVCLLIRGGPRCPGACNVAGSTTSSTQRRRQRFLPRLQGEAGVSSLEIR